MPCIKCNNGKWKYGEHGKCIYDTLSDCKKAAAAIHIKEDCNCSKKQEIGPIAQEVRAEDS